ncbi:EF-hand calcium-binding domain-containing protein 11-like isoform X7 [Balaenoptera acutorostrata]|uniref:EF-hand calcium-binding domain-containing protein 11-like isoform X7 n=1 Tax=Balaenoptera acutorostrata TaxID=9767 RepID=A0ABM3T9U6_BALAC|nr:EF-hand calcium-binding domain-containing protein 11-like isoform X7 [Balaenoptera acutorostrata]
MFFSQAGARPRMWEASPSEHKKWVEVFKACDEENKGCLSRENFKVAVVMLFGYKPSKIEADAVMSSVDPNTSDRGYLTLEDFKKAFKQVAPKLSERIVLEVFRHVSVFPGGTVIKNLPANAGDTDSSPGLGRSHMPRSN